MCVYEEKNEKNEKKKDEEFFFNEKQITCHPGKGVVFFDVSLDWAKVVFF